MKNNKVLEFFWHLKFLQEYIYCVTFTGCLEIIIINSFQTYIWDSAGMRIMCCILSVFSRCTNYSIFHIQLYVDDSGTSFIYVSCCRGVPTDVPRKLSKCWRRPWGVAEKSCRSGFQWGKIVQEVAVVEQQFIRHDLAVNKEGADAS